MKEQLQLLRKNKNLTQEEISDIIGVKLSTYQKYERDAISPPYETLIKIADFYGVTTDYLLGRSTDTPPLSQLASQFNMSALEREIVDGYLSLPEDMREELMDFLEKAVAKVQAESRSEVPAGKKVFKIASSKDNHPGEIKTLSPEEAKRLDSAADVTSEDSDL